MRIAICDRNEKDRDMIIGILKRQDSFGHGMTLACFACIHDLYLELGSSEKYKFDIIIDNCNLEGSDAEEYISMRKRKHCSHFIMKYGIYHTSRYTGLHLNIEHLEIELQIAGFLTTAKEDFIIVKTNSGLEELVVREIIFIERTGRHIMVHIEKKCVETGGRMMDFERDLCKYNFHRIHAGFIVNMARVKQAQRQLVIMDSGNQLPLSRYRKKCFFHEMEKRGYIDKTYF